MKNWDDDSETESVQVFSIAVPGFVEIMTPMEVLVVDIGNGSAKAARMVDRRVVSSLSVPTASLTDPESGIYRWMGKEAGTSVVGVSYCSVVPSVADDFEDQVEAIGLPIFNLNHRTVSDLRIDYPCPPEIGQDRLANALAGKFLHGAPLVVIDFGTAVTFDVIGGDGAYQGGVIVPGLNLMVDYLHEKTALLPAVNIEDRTRVGAIGKSTVEAIRSGYSHGFEGMIEGILKAIFAEMATAGDRAVRVITTGGSGPWLPGTKIGQYLYEPNLTLTGLAIGLELSTFRG